MPDQPSSDSQEPDSDNTFAMPDVSLFENPIDGFEIVGVLGRGGMGTVYKAREIESDRKVAIKIMHGDFAGDNTAHLEERFEREADAMAHLSHENIVPIHQFGRTDDGRLFFAMEYIDGVDVQAHLDSGPVPVEQIREWLMQACRALDYAHSKGVVHRDIKPANLLIDGSGSLRITDFGVAKFAGDYDDEQGFTQTGLAVGTRDYIAPEAIENPQAIDHRADLYALGVTAFQLLTGRIPRGIPEMPSRLRPELDPGWDRILTRALSEHPDRRYATATEMAAALGATSTSKNARRRDKKTGKNRSRRAIALSLLAAAVVGAAALGAKAFLGNRPDIADLPDQSFDKPGNASLGDETIDLLALLDVEAANKTGTWHKNAWALLLEDGDEALRIEIPHRPPPEFDFEIEFEILPESVRQGYVAQSFPIPGANIELILQSNPSRSLQSFGFHHLDGRRLDQTPEAHVKRALLFESKRRYRSRVEVRRDSLSAFLNDELLVLYDGDMERFHDADEGRTWSNPTLGLGAWNAGVVFHSATLTPADSGATATPLPAPPIPEPIHSIPGWSVNWLPDGKAVVINQGSITTEPRTPLVMVDLETGRRMVVHEEGGKAPAFSPTGDGSLVFVTYRDDSQFIAKKAPNGQVTFLTEGGSPSWSADGDTIYFYHLPSQHIMALENLETQPVVTPLMECTTHLYPMISPDGRKVAYQHHSDLVVADLESGRVLHDFPLSDWQGILLGWSPDSRYVGFGSYGQGDTRGLWVKNVENGWSIQVLPGNLTRPRWSPDGTMIACEERQTGQVEIFRVSDLNLP